MKQTYVLRTTDIYKRLLTALSMTDIREEKPIAVSIYPYKGKRSLDQNARYWEMLTRLARITGNDKEDLHEYFKQKFLPPRSVMFKDGETMVSGSTTKTSPEEMSAYMDQVESFCAQEGYDVWE